MSFHLSTWSVKNPVSVLVLFLFFSIFGLFSFFQLGINDQPNIDVPVVQVTITQRGAGPEELEFQVTQKVEDAVSSVNLIDSISSTVNDGRSVTTINFELEADANQATNDVRNAIAQIRQDLPADINEPIVQKLEFAGGAIATYVVSSEKRSVDELTDLVDRRIARDLANVDGVAQVNRIGGKDREVRIDLDPARLQAYNITATEVNEQVRNLNLNLSGGRSNLGEGEQNIRTIGSAQTVRNLANYPIILSNGDTIPLKNLGEIRDGFAEARQSAYLNNEAVVGFSILRSTGSNLVTVADNVEKKLEQIKQNLPDDINIELIFTRATAIRNSYEGTIGSLIIGSILTVISVGIFLRDIRATLITGLALPLSIIPTFLVMQVLNYTLNGMTLLALALAMGNLVDDAICMIENIDQHLNMGKKPYQAAMDAAREIGLAVVATTATIVAVFLPVAFMGGVPGQFFQPFGVTVAVATMFSTLVATTMTPMLSAYLLKSKPAHKRYNHHDINPSGKWHPYRSLLKWALRNKISTLLIALIFFIGSLQLIPYIPQGLFTEPDQGLSLVEVELPPGASLENTEKIVFDVTNKLTSQSAVENVLANIGENDVSNALLYVNLLPKENREVSLQDFQSQMRPIFKQIPGARVTFRSQGAGGGSKDLTIVLKSDDGQILTETAQELEKQMQSIPGLVEVSSSASLVKPEIIIQPDLAKAGDLGVSVNAIARTASLATIGDNDSNLAKFNLRDRQIPIRVQINPEYRQNIETIKNLKVPTNDGSLVTLDSVASIRLATGPAEIQRYNRQRQVELGANLQGISLGDALEAVKALPIMNPLPSEVSEEPAGDAEIMRDVFTRFLSAVFLAISCIYAILVLLYGNFLYPFAILAALPLSIGGALLGLLITQKELALFALIGIVLLLGLVTKNAILLVDFALSGMKEGKSQRDAVIYAGVSRLRPIVMTSISTIAGMLPIALAWGADGEVRSPMAIAVIGGFTTSTLLTLIVVPVIFCYVDNFIHWLSKLWRNEQAEEVQQVLNLEETLNK
ncbi:efflux RND transporter permease subunit [Cyanobacterium aponinum FACHB-4101]|uniref:efflux RND transporter permease subunit n=1 Tax=Cyanobacterium aponinum TaxID=379064 RepID=UPI0016807765|nr:efflux RND transporter permease subunit [Cyanobacterium aponinum]MBD2395669.1 efflux RND transporter permease subunit [Cyanobacterium aponinum FACHB-4101]